MMLERHAGSVPPHVSSSCSKSADSSGPRSSALAGRRLVTVLRESMSFVLSRVLSWTAGSRDDSFFSSAARSSSPLPALFWCSPALASGAGAFAPTRGEAPAQRWHSLGHCHPVAEGRRGPPGQPGVRCAVNSVELQSSRRSGWTISDLVLPKATQVGLMGAVMLFSCYLSFLVFVCEARDVTAVMNLEQPSFRTTCRGTRVSGSAIVISKVS